MKVINQTEVRLANLVICGVNKAGSTSLYSYLSDHPEISPSKVKETFFFRSVLYQEPLGDMEEYASFFDQEADERYLMEADPRYFYGKKPLANAMKEHLTDDLKVLVLLRDPVRRFVSFYKFKYFNFRPGVAEMDFESFLDRCLVEYEERKDEPFVRGDYLYVRALKEGLYIDYLKDWIDVYRDRFKVCFFDDLKSHPLHLMEEISRWLGIDPQYYQSYTFTQENKTVPPKHKRLHMVANFLNEKFENFWLKQPLIKKSIRQIYYTFNSSSERKVKVSEKSLAKLREFYSLPNVELKAYLESKGEKRLPDWLS